MRRMDKIETLAWLDGEILPVQEIRISPLAHSLHYGTGVFEGIRCYEQEAGGGGVFRLREHMERLIVSARILGYEVPHSVDQLMEAAVQTLRENGMSSAYIRPLVWLDEGGMGVAGGNNPVRTMIAVWHWGAYLGEDGLRNGIRTQLSSYERATGNASASRAKITGQYVTSFMAKRQAIALGLDEGLLVDRDGYLAEGTGENLFIARGGLIATAPDASPILHGITRGTVLTLLADLGFEVRYERFTRTDLYAADEAFLTGTAAEVTPIREIDGRALRESPGPVTRALQETFQSVVRGQGERAAEWITPV
ncbi:MAG: branched-chain amino acid transaminase [Planctomycetota bacterium]